MRLALLIVSVLCSLPCEAAETCRPLGYYVRVPAEGPPAEFTVSTAPVGSPEGEALLGLETIGQRMPDGLDTFGAVKGRFRLSQTGCTGAYLEGDNCAIFIAFARQAAEVHQFGDCGFGAYASADGKYKRLSHRKREP